MYTLLRLELPSVSSDRAEPFLMETTELQFFLRYIWSTTGRIHLAKLLVRRDSRRWIIFRILLFILPFTNLLFPECEPLHLLFRLAALRPLVAEMSLTDLTLLVSSSPHLLNIVLPPDILTSTVKANCRTLLHDVINSVASIICLFLRVAAALPITVAARSEAWCLRAPERWDRGFESHSRQRELFAFILCLCCSVCRQRSCDQPSKKSYRLCIGLRNWKRGQGRTKMIVES
jgi:hypothetical protein